MAQIFARRATFMARLSFTLVPFLLISCGIAIAYSTNWSDWTTRRFAPIQQPIPFSHQHHVGGLGIDCRYCHAGVENSPIASLPSTETCMNCHSQMWTQAPMLDPVRTSWNSGKPIEWNRVHDLPDYVYFDHSIHVAKGVGCSTCHGDVGAMPLEERVVDMQMRWCIDCHRDPEKHLRPADEIFNPQWVEPADQLSQGRALAQLYHVQENQLTNCSLCHR